MDMINYYLDIAEAVSKRSDCLNESCGALIEHDGIVSAACSVIPKGRISCMDMGSCGLKRGNGCRCIRAETAAILNAGKKNTDEAKMYICARNKDGYDSGYVPDSEQRKLILNAGISSVIIRADKENYVCVNTDNWITGE